MNGNQEPGRVETRRKSGPSREQGNSKALVAGISRAESTHCTHCTHSAPRESGVSISLELLVRMGTKHSSFFLLAETRAGVFSRPHPQKVELFT